MLRTRHSFVPRTDAARFCFGRRRLEPQPPRTFPAAFPRPRRFPWWPRPRGSSGGGPGLLWATVPAPSQKNLYVNTGRDLGVAAWPEHVFDIPVWKVRVVAVGFLWGGCAAAFFVARIQIRRARWLITFDFLRWGWWHRDEWGICCSGWFVFLMSEIFLGHFDFCYDCSGVHMLRRWRLLLEINHSD